jgi:receptor protein-tyrosine kinase
LQLTTGFLPVAKRWWWLLVASTIVAAVAGYAVVSRQDPRYQANAKVLVGPLSADIDTLRAASQLSQTYADLARSRPLWDQAAEGLGVSLADTEVEATPNEVTRIITLSVTDPRPEVAADVANEFADNLVELSTGSTATEGRVQVIDRAGVPSQAEQPNAILLALLAGLAGLLGSFTLVLVVEQLRSRVANAGELAELTGTPVLASLDGIRRSRDGAAGDEGPEGAAYRLLASEVEFFGHRDGPLSSLLVLGAQGGEGAGDVAASLAGTLAFQGRRITLVDANVVEGEITAQLGLDGQLGMAELARHAELADRGEELLRHFRLPYEPGLDVIARGAIDGPEVVDPERARLLLERLLQDSDIVIVGTPPLHRSASGLAWARVVDAALLVAARDVTKRERVSHTVESLRRAGANLIGAVLTSRPVRTERKRSEAPAPEVPDVERVTARARRSDGA